MGRLDADLFGSAAGLLDKLIALELARQGAMVRTDLLKEGMELRTMVHVAQVTEFVAMKHFSNFPAASGFIISNIFLPAK